MTESSQVEEVLSETATVTSSKNKTRRARGGIVRRESGQACPLSFGQQRFWFLEQVSPGNFANHVVNAFRLIGSVDADALQHALDTIVARHEALRTTFHHRDADPVQVIDSPRPVELRSFDLTADGADTSPEAVDELLRAEVQRPFDLSRDLMLRASLVQLSGNEHILLLIAHHIASDGWSFGILRHELAEAYQARKDGREPELNELPVQYADFTLWQREQMAGSAYEGKLEYWKTQLQGAPATLDLPMARSRPVQPSGRGAREHFRLSAGLSRRLKQFAASENSTLYMALLAACQTLLHRYSGQTDICIGSPFAARTRKEIEGLIGFFVNSVIMRGDLSGKPSFRELVRRARRTAIEAYARQDLPFDRLVEVLQPDRSNYPPLFQIMLILQNAPESAMDLPGLEATAIDFDSRGAKLDLAIAFREQDSELTGYIEYSSDLFDGAGIRQMIGHMEVLVREMLDSPDQPVSSFCMLSEAERQQMLVEWNDTTNSFPDKCVHELIEEQAAREPDAPAVAFENGRLTYGELSKRSNRLAQHLCEIGVGPGSLIGLFVDRSVDVAVGILGALKAGAAYVPLDPAYPRERLAMMAEDAELTVLLTQSHLLESLPAKVDHAVAVDTFDWNRPSDTALPAVSPRDRVYVIYTSGSTGKPKGVSIEHHSFVNLLQSFGRNVEFSERDHLMATSTLSFDMGNLDVFLPLFYGASFTIVTRDVAADAHALAEAIATSGTTYMQATPATFRLLLESGWEGKQDLRILSGGEKLTRSLVNRLHQKCQAVWNGYGPTETTMCSAMVKVEPGEGPVSIGRPIDNTLLYVVDSEMQPVPMGVPGELYIGGVGLAREYLNRPELTAERFIHNPFGPGRLYKTGDLVRWWPDGQLEFMGRGDDQVKVRGFRIELGEIEAALLLHQAVSGACVTVREDTPGGAYLAAYYVADPARSTSDKELREFLRQQLPGHMVPSRMVAVERFPLTPNGKVDRKALPAPPAQVQSDETNSKPATPMQKLIAEVWEKALGMEGVGIHDNFYELGGHSLLSVQVIKQLEERAGVRIHPGVMVFQSLGQLAARYEKKAKPVTEAPQTSTWKSRFTNLLQRVIGTVSFSMTNLGIPEGL